MPRQLRLEYVGAIYHLMGRGNRREITFRQPVLGRKKELLAQVREKVGPSHYGRERQEAAEEKAKRIQEGRET